jgi:hypothetical protein
MADSLDSLKSEKECVYCGNDGLKKIIVAPDAEVICRECGAVLGRLRIPPRTGTPVNLSGVEWNSR